MSLKTMLLATTSICVLGFAPLPSFAQDAALTAAYEAYVTASSGDNADAKAAAEAAFLVECERVGVPTLEECIALVNATAAPATTEPAPAGEPTAAEDPAAEQPASEAGEPAAEQPAAEAPATEQPTGEQPTSEQPTSEAPATYAPAADAPAADQPAAEQPEAPAASAASDSELIAAYEAYVAANSGTDDAAKASAEAAFLAECNRLGIASLDECLALLGVDGSAAQAAPAAEAGALPVEVIPNVEATDAPLAPATDSGKEAEQRGEPLPTEAPAEQKPAPVDNASANTAPPPSEEEVTATVETTGQPIDTLTIEPPPAANAEAVTQTDDNRFVLNFGVNLVIYTPYDDRDRIGREGDEVTYEQLDNGRVRQVVTREDGTKVITVWNRYGEIIRRVKVRPDGTRIVMIFDRDDDRDRWRDPGDDLPPFYLNIPVEEYVLYSENADEDDIELFLSEPPLEQFDVVYSVDEVKRSARLRDTVRRVEIGDLTFDTGESTVERDQVGSLTKVANAMLKLLERNPGEIFLIEGHTDAVGSDESNLELSDRRAETVARLLTEFYDVPPENLVTQGYGERYLKVETEDAERANRRATVRRITPLVASVD